MAHCHGNVDGAKSAGVGVLSAAGGGFAKCDEVKVFGALDGAAAHLIGGSVAVGRSRRSC